MSKYGKEAKAKKVTKIILPTGEVTYETEENIISRYNENGYLYRNRTKVLKMFTDRQYPEGLTWADKGKIAELERYIGTDQLIIYKTGNRPKPHTVTTISKILGTNERMTRLFINKLKKMKIIKEIKINDIKYYVFNPLYRLKGNRISMTTYIAFEEELQAILPKWVIDNFMADVQELHTNVKLIN